MVRVGSLCRFHFGIDLCGSVALPDLYLFSEGVLFAEKDFNLPKHPELEVPNLQVIKLMQSFKSKGFVRETFAWRHYYWYLTNEGIEHLRDYLNLPSEIVPATLKKSSRPPGRPMGAGGDRPPRRFEGGRGYGDREGYRGYGAGGDDKAGAPGAYKPAFREGGGRGGFGRGAGGYGGGDYGSAPGAPGAPPPAV
ncbi:unnamed protein product [Closterium sp. NIES-54]